MRHRKCVIHATPIQWNLVQWNLDLRKIFGVARKFPKSRYFLFQTQQGKARHRKCVIHATPLHIQWNLVQYALDLRKILGVAKKFLKSRSFLFQTSKASEVCHSCNTTTYTVEFGTVESRFKKDFWSGQKLC